MKLHIHQAQRDPDRGGTGDRERVAGEPGQKSPQNGCDDEAEQKRETLPATIERKRNYLDALQEDVDEATKTVKFAEEELQQHARDFISKQV